MEFLKYNIYEYVFSAPENPEGKLPVIIFLHGAGTRGTSLECLSGNAFFKESSLYASGEHPCLIFAPLCMDSSWFDRFEQLQDFVKFALSHPNADPNRLYFIGTSMGGYGVWQLAMTMKDYVAALFPVCGGGCVWNYKTLLNVPVWTVHGANDTTVDPKDSIAFVEKISNHEGEAHLTLVPDTKHNCWDYAFAQREIYDWLFSKSKNKHTKEVSDEYGNNSKNFG